jgi:spore coat polysaccharide biosynthesis protein SpsF
VASILIAIQARSTSKRLPGKSLELIDDRTMVGHVYDAALQSAQFMNSVYRTDVALLVPYGDKIKEWFAGSHIIEGPENDVLARFESAYKKLVPDYIVRLTADCPLIIPTIITKHIQVAVTHKRDYVTNTFNDMRTYVDGYDVEVISSRLFQWLMERAKTPYDREHVTTVIRDSAPPWARMASIMGFIDLSHIKLSVDTIDELNEVRKNKEGLTQKLKLAKEKGYQVYRM